nr:ATP synthase F0 subunit 8 [Semimytilus algosus]
MVHFFAGGETSEMVLFGSYMSVFLFMWFGFVFMCLEVSFWWLSGKALIFKKFSS